MLVSRTHTRHKQHTHTQNIKKNNLLKKYSRILSPKMRRYCLIFAVCRLLSGVFCPPSALWLSMYAHTHTRTHIHKYIRFILRYFSKFSCGFFAVVYRSRLLFMRYMYIHMYKYIFMSARVDIEMLFPSSLLLPFPSLFLLISYIF